MLTPTAPVANDAANRYISLMGMCRVVGESTVPDKNKPNVYAVECEWKMSKDTPITLISTYFNFSGPLAVGSVVAATGELQYLPGDSEGEVDANNFWSVAEPEDAHLLSLPPPNIYAVGQVDSTEGRDWILMVATYDRTIRAHKKFKVKVLVPLSGRFANLRGPAKGTVVSIRGLLASVTAAEEIAIELEAVTFIPTSNTNRQAAGSTLSPSASASLAKIGATGRTKRQRRQDLESTPSKKARIDSPESSSSNVEVSESAESSEPIDKTPAKAPAKTPVKTRSKAAEAAETTVSA